MVLLETTSDGQNWVRDLYLRHDSLRKMPDLLWPSKPMDSIRLLLPWGKERNFLIPAANPCNPVFETKARGATENAFRDAVAHGIGVIGVDYGREELSVRTIRYKDFCAVSVREEK